MDYKPAFPQNRIEPQDRKNLVVGRLSPEAQIEMSQYITAIGSHNFSLQTLLVTPGLYEISRKAEALRLKAGIRTNNTFPEIVGHELSSIYGKIAEAVVNPSQNPILIRWVGVENQNDLESIIETSKTNGGKQDERAGLCMSPVGSKADDTMAMDITKGKRGILFIYNRGSLEGLTKEESEADINFAGGYGYKPKAGETYQSALLGVIAF